MVKTFVQRPDELRRDSSGDIDEVVVHDLHLAHLEKMDDRSWWMGLTRGNRTLHVWIQSDKKGHLDVTVTDDELGCRDPGSPRAGSDRLRDETPPRGC